MGHCTSHEVGAGSRKWEFYVKKGRHRRYEEARKAKRGVPLPIKTCDECGGDAVRGHADWCLAVSEDDIFEVQSPGAEMSRGEVYAEDIPDQDS